jgi:hypothetical protein
MLPGLALVLAFSLAATTANARPDNAGLSPAGRQISFDELLRSPDDLRFEGNSASRSIAFRCEPNTVPGSRSVLHLFLRHSPDLDSSRSFLSVTLNYGVLRSVRLEREEASELLIPLPQNLVKAENELTISVEQFGAAGARPESLWTAISARSYVWLDSERRRAPLDLNALPAALLDPDPAEPIIFDVLVPTRPSTATLEATALLLATFARRLAPAPVSLRPVASPDAAGRALIIVGTPAEQPGLQVKAESTAVLETGGSGPVTLIVSGTNALGVLRAAHALIEQKPPATGSSATFPSDVPHSSPAPREWPGFVPAADRFSLADLGFRNVRFAAAENYAASIPLNTAPDALFLRYGPEVVLSLQCDPAVYDANPELVLELNGTTIRRAMVRDLSRRPQFTYTVTLPGHLLRTGNTLRAILRGVPANLGLESAALLLPDTQFYLPRDYRAAFPDLGFLRHYFYPFSINGDLAGTVVLVPDAVDGPLFGAVIHAAAAMGRLMPGRTAGFAVRRMGEITTPDLSSSNIVFLGAGALPDTPATRPLLPRLPAEPGGAIVQESISPWNPKRFILSITARSTAALEDAAGRTFSDGVLVQLAGDTASIGSGRPRCYALAARRTFEQSSYMTHLQARLRANWMALPGVLLLVSGVLFLGLRLALAHYRNGSR